MRMLVLRRVATADLPARHAHAQVHPSIAELYALWADVAIERDVVDHRAVLALDHVGARVVLLSVLAV
jgi:hypothetical protein